MTRKNSTGSRDLAGPAGTVRRGGADPDASLDWLTETDPGVDEALARIYLKTYRLRSAKTVIDRWIDRRPGRRPAFPLAHGDRSPHRGRQPGFLGSAITVRP